VALLGWAFHGLLFKAIWRYAVKSAESRAHRVAKAYLPGIYIVLGWYLGLTALAALLLSRFGQSPLLSLLLFMLLFRLGDVAVKWRHGLTALTFRRRVSRLDADRLSETGRRYGFVRDWWIRTRPSPAESTTVTVRAIA
jgi:hypothetical protein